MCIRLETCCGCQNVEVGTKIVASLVIALGIASFIVNLFQLQYGGLASGLLMSLFGGLLMFGATKKKRQLVVTWLVLAFFLIIFQVMNCVYAVYDLTAQPEEIDVNSEKFGMLLAGALIALVDAGLQIYFWIVVYSYNKELEERDGSQIVDPESK